MHCHPQNLHRNAWRAPGSLVAGVLVTLVAGLLTFAAPTPAVAAAGLCLPSETTGCIAGTLRT
jgi:hypothetical protein